MLVYYFVPFIVSNRYLLFWISNGHNSVTVQNRTHIYMNFFDHKDLGNHLLQLCPEVVKHPVYVCVIWARAFCVWSTGDAVLLEAVRPFPAATRTFTKRLRHDTAERGSGQCRLCELSWDVLCVVCGRHGVFRSGSAFSGCHSNFHEMAIVWLSVFSPVCVN